MGKKFICRQCKEEKNEDPRTLFQEDEIGFVLFQPLRKECLDLISSHPLDELFPLKV